MEVCYERAVKAAVKKSCRERSKMGCCAWSSITHPPSSSRMTELQHGPPLLMETGLVYLMFSIKLQGRRQQHRVYDAITFETMEYFSLKRSTVADRGQANLSSKVYVRSTKSGKVQKIVRELYLRQDIPCSSNLCRECLEIAPTDYSKKGACVDHIDKGSANSN